MQISCNEFNNILRIAFSQQFDDVPQKESAVEYEFTENFKKRMGNLILKQQKASWKMTNTVSKRVAVLVTVMILFIAGTMSVSAIREPILRFITEVFDTHIDFRLEGKTTDVITTEYELTWLPDGFEMVDKSKSEHNVITTYRDGSGHEIQLWQEITQNINSSIDNEQGDVKIVCVNNKELIMNMGEKASIALWTEDRYMMDLVYQGYVDEETMLKMIESVSPSKDN